VAVPRVSFLRQAGALRDGKTKAEALQAAQLRQLAASTRSQPFYWAALELLGDWR